MKYAARAFFNVDTTFTGYRSDDRLAPSTLNPMYGVEGATPTAAADKVFAMLNADERPNGQTERSLSVGDVVSIEDNEGGITVLACEAVGWRNLPPDAVLE